LQGQAHGDGHGKGVHGQGHGQGVDVDVLHGTALLVMGPELSQVSIRDSGGFQYR
jgi:hypothetical protein